MVDPHLPAGSEASEVLSGGMAVEEVGHVLPLGFASFFNDLAHELPQKFLLLVRP
jgi:hypothetical protein